MQTMIGSFRVEIEDSECFVQWGKYSASLAVLEDYGYLEGSEGELKVPQTVIRKISKWACKNGY